MHHTHHPATTPKGSLANSCQNSTPLLITFFSQTLFASRYYRGNATKRSPTNAVGVAAATPQHSFQFICLPPSTPGSFAGPWLQTDRSASTLYQNFARTTFLFLQASKEWSRPSSYMKTGSYNLLIASNKLQYSQSKHRRCLKRMEKHAPCLGEQALRC